MSEISSADFSETDASNNATPPAGWPEGMNADKVNDSARGLAGALKRFWGRIQGINASTGSANAYVLTPTVALAAYVTGERYSFRANFTNTGSATLAISGLTARTIKKFGAAGAANLDSGDIQNGQPVTVEADTTNLIMVTPLAATPLTNPMTTLGDIIIGGAAGTAGTAGPNTGGTGGTTSLGALLSATGGERVRPGLSGLNRPIWMGYRMGCTSL